MSRQPAEQIGGGAISWRLACPAPFLEVCRLEVEAGSGSRTGGRFPCVPARSAARQVQPPRVWPQQRWSSMFAMPGIVRGGALKWFVVASAGDVSPGEIVPSSERCNPHSICRRTSEGDNPQSSAASDSNALAKVSGQPNSPRFAAAEKSRRCRSPSLAPSRMNASVCRFSVGEPLATDARRYAFPSASLPTRASAPCQSAVACSFCPGSIGSSKAAGSFASSKILSSDSPINSS